MPKRTDIAKILIIGSGPIVIGQACEFDYSGTQACRVLESLGYEVVLVNSNPATIMTDPQLAHATYLEPITAEYVATIIDKERPDALLPTMGGQTALNVTMELAEAGVLERAGVELIGANLDAIRTAEDREEFKRAMLEIGLDVPRSGTVSTVDDAVALCDGTDGAPGLGYPVVIRPAFTLGGGGGGTAHDEGELRRICGEGLRLSPVTQVLIEESVYGWKEFELEVMRDLADNVVIICSIENLDPMGVHTGDSITVAPQQTLTDVEYQAMRDDALACIRRIGVETGGSNIQFAVDPATGRRIVIEMNPRVSRSSALASKATGFPIAKIAAQLAVGFTLDEIPNDITKQTPASFEPVIDYVVTKVPRWAFEKFPGADTTLGTMMRSVGEVMAIGRTFPESLQKALRSMENGRAGLNADAGEAPLDDLTTDELLELCTVPTPERIFAVEAALRSGAGIDDVHAASRIDPWFLAHIDMLVAARRVLAARGMEGCGAASLRDAKRLGFADAQLAWLWGVDESVVRNRRRELGVRPVFKTVDTCASEFEAHTPYHYSTYEDDSEVRTSGRERVVILGSGPNRIGQGVEFDFCCVRAVYSLEEAGYETVMVNCNPETVSTDYDTASQLFFEPLTLEDVLEVVDAVEPVGVLVQLGGQTPLKLAAGLEAEGVPILGTSPHAIDLAEDREQFAEICRELELAQPAGGTATTPEEAAGVADSIGYPVLLRPSYVLGGRAMEIVYTGDDVTDAAVRMAADGAFDAGPLLIDRFLEDAIEVDVDCCFDGTTFLLGGIMEHIEEAGVHSGDSACVVPPPTLAVSVQREIAVATERLARRLEVRGLMNVQFAVRGDDVYVLEANPRASRTIPYVSKALAVPLAKLAARVMLGQQIADLEADGWFRRPPGVGETVPYLSVKEAVLPFLKFPGADALIGPEMRSTGEVMGIDERFGTAYGKSQSAAGVRLPTKGRVFLSLADRDKRRDLLSALRELAEAGFDLVATTGTADWLRSGGLDVVATVQKVGAGSGDDTAGATAVDLIADGTIDAVINTPRGRGARADGSYIRSAAVAAGIPVITTVAGAKAAIAAIADDRNSTPSVRSLQEWHALLAEHRR